MNQENVKVKRIFIGIAALFLTVFIIAFISGLVIFDSEAYRMKSQANDMNQKGLALMEKDRYEEALECFQKALEYATEYDQRKDKDSESKESGVLYSDAYNNLSYAYYSLLDYDLSLEYGQKAVDTPPNDSYEYANLANALYSLGRSDEAMNYYTMAIEDDSESKYAYYGKGSIFYDKGEYQNALDMFEIYLDYEPTDKEVRIDVIYCSLYLGETDKALELVNSELKSAYSDIELYKVKGEILSKQGYEKAEEFYLWLSKEFHNNAEAQILLGEFYYNNAKYQQALDHFLRSSRMFPKNTEIDSWVVYCYEKLEDQEGMLAYTEEVEKQGYGSYELYQAVGNTFTDKSLYMEALPYYEKAMEADPENEEATIAKLNALYCGKRYSRCIEFGKTAMTKFADNYDIPYYIGDSYYGLYDYKEAITYYNKALEIDPESETMLSFVGYSYLMLEDYVKAEEYADKTFAINPDNTTAQEIMDTIAERKKPINTRLKEFIRENYLYYEENPDIEKLMEQHLNKESLTNSEIEEAIEGIKQKEDIFTFVLYDEIYDYLKDSNLDDVEFRTFDDICYLRIFGFNINTDNRVTEQLDQIEKSEDKTLAIDLRGNSGGLADCANHILDLLLPEYVASTMIDRKGNTYSYYSDASRIKFKKIYVLIDENSASASELVTLGLKTYLNNVTILGRNSFGKGVGQIVFEDKEQKLMVFLVDLYWNIRQKNIVDTNIAPDIYVESEKLEDYIKIINENK